MEGVGLSRARAGTPSIWRQEVIGGRKYRIGVDHSETGPGIANRQRVVVLHVCILRKRWGGGGGGGGG